MRNTVKNIVLASRPISWVNTAYPFGAAYMLTTRHWSWTFVLGSLFFLIPYNLLMYSINDVFDYETDILNPRKGGLEGAKHLKAQLRTLLIVSLGVSVPTSIGMLLLGGTAAKLTLIADLFFVCAYSLPKLRFKERPFLDSITSSCHFTGPMVYALVLTGWHATYLPIVAALFLWGIASHAFGAVQDINPDRAAGIGSIATVIGAARTVWFAVIAYLLAFAVLLPVSTAARLAGACSLLYIANISPYLGVSDKSSARTNAAWKRFIKLNFFVGFIVTLILIATFRGNL